MGFWWELLNAPMPEDDDQWNDFTGKGEVTDQ